MHDIECDNHAHRACHKGEARSRGQGSVWLLTYELVFIYTSLLVAPGLTGFSEATH